MCVLDKYHYELKGPPKTYVEALTSNVMVFEDQTFER